jgi:type IV pilus assembly protein PilM
MALPFTKRPTAKKRDSIIAVDLGGRTTKAVHMQKRADQYVLSGYALLDAPIYEKSLSAEMLGEHLKAVCQALDTRTRQAVLVIGANDSIIRHTDLPTMPVGDMRQVLKMNPKNYLQQDLQGYVFDCFVTSAQPTANAAAPDSNKPKSALTLQKQRVLVGGARRQLIEELQEAMKNAGLTADSVMPSLLGPINAFELAMPEVFARENVALIDLGFKSTSIGILQEGNLALSRVVNIGGDKLTAVLAEVLSISYAEAEGIKIGMPTEVQPHLESIITTLGRELRASIDYFEHQHDKTVSRALISGGTAQSELIVQFLQTELMIECKPWNPALFTQPLLPPQQAAELEAMAAQLTVAIGAAVAAL